MSIWYKRYRDLHNKISKRFKKTPIEVIRVKELRNTKRSDIERWSRSDVLHENWQDRTLLLAKHIKNGSKVVEFGAGSAILKNELDISIQYQAVDIVKRKEDYLVCDLNQHPLSIDLSLYDTAIFSGVLEYVYDIDALFAILLSNNLKNVAMSYACSDISKQDRLIDGWLSDYTSKDLEIIFDKYDFKIIHIGLWKNQSIYILEHD